MINNLPNELLLEIFDFYRQGISRRQKWREKYIWFNLSRVCKIWRAIVFASSSRLDVCLYLKPKNATHMKTLMSTDALIPIVRNQVLKFPATFLKGTNLHLRLRSLKLHPISLTSISQLLLSATALTNLSLEIDGHREVPDLLHLLSQLKGMPYLRRLYLGIICFTDYLGPLTEPKERFPLAELTSFHYSGYSTFLDILTMGFEAPSLQDVNIFLHDWTPTLPPIPHLPQFINDIEEHYRAVQVVLRKKYIDFSFSEGVGHHSLRFRFHSSLSPDLNIQDWMMEITSMLSSKLSTTKKLVSIFEDMREVIPWRTFLKHFPSVKEFQMQGTNNHRVASALQPYHGGSGLSILPVLERITFRITYAADRSSALAVFQPFVSARQQAGRPVQVTCFTDPLIISVR